MITNPLSSLVRSRAWLCAPLESVCRSAGLLVAVMLVLLAPVVSAQTLSPWGVSCDSTTKNTLSTWGPQMASAGIKSVRGFQLFNTIEPTQGTFSWTTTDTQMSAASTNGLAEIGMFGLNASWINSNVQTFPTANLSAWSTYVAATVTHCDANVKYWEVWNEPPNFTSGTGTETDYANVVVDAYNAAKGVDSSCYVGIAAKSADINWLDQSIADGAADHFDFITLHPYEIFGTIDYGWEAEYMSIVPSVRKMLAARDAAKQNVPVIFTEVGEPVGQVNGSLSVTTTIQAQDLVKAYVMGVAQGVAQTDWFEGKDGDSGAFGLIDSSGNPRPAYTAYAKVIANLGSAPVYKGWVQLNTAVTPNRDYGFVFQGATTTVLACWAPPGVTDTITWGTPVTVVDPVAGTTTTNVTTTSLTNAPILVVGVPSALVTTATNNKTKPFPWNGDFTNANFVTCLMGPVNNEQGLHQLYADTYSTGTSAYGCPARNVSLKASQYFVVDPNFLSYTTTPITITVVARRDAANDIGKITSMTYESTVGYKASTAPAWTIPGNDQWYVNQYTVTDPQLVGMYAYNLNFYSSYDNYLVQSVTVTKGSTATMPAAPTGLTATGATNQVQLHWNASSGAASYSVYRGTTSGYESTVPIASGLSTTSFTDTAVTPGTTYYYEVMALSTTAPSIYSNEASAVPIAGLPAPWANADIGTTGATGTSTYSSGAFTVTGAGAGSSTADAFQYAYQPVTGDCTITARFASTTNSNANAYGGVMIRETLTPGSTFAAAILQPGGVSAFLRRLTTGVASTIKHGTASPPTWLRVQRSGSNFSAYTSSDGTTWSQLGGTVTISMASSIYIGLGNTSGVNGTLTSGTLDNVSVTTP